ncbi:MAG: PAS domain-containing protein [Ferruginibacter sp.]
MKQKRKTLFSDLLFLSITLIFLWVSFISYQRIVQLNNDFGWINHSYQVKLNLEQLLSNVKDVESSQRGFLLTKDSIFLVQFEESKKNTYALLSNIDSLTNDNKPQQQKAIELKTLIDRRFELLSRGIELYHDKNSGFPASLAKGREQMDRVRLQAKFMIEDENHLLIERTKVKDKTASITPWYTLLLSLAAILVVIIAYFRTRVETSLRFRAEDSEETIHNFFMQVPAMVAILKGPEHRFEFINPSFIELLGKADLTGKTVYESIPELNSPTYHGVLNQVYQTGMPFIGKEMKISFGNTKGVKNIYVNLILQAYKNTSGQNEGILVFGYDVSEQVIIRKKIEEIELRSRLAIEAAQMGTFDWNLQSQEFISSDRLIEIFGFKNKPGVKHEELINVFHPEDKPIRNRAVADSYEKGSLEYEARVIWPDSSVHWINVFGKIIHNENREPLRMYGTVIDITRQKNILVELKESESKLRSLADSMKEKIAERTFELAELNKELLLKNNIFAQAETNALIGSYSWSLHNGNLEYSDNLFRLLGFEPGEFVPSFEKYLSFIHPDDLEQVKKDGKETFETRELVEHVHRVITKDGKLKYFRSSGKVFGEEEDTALIGTVQDVSHDTLMNEKLRKQNIDLERSNAELESFNYIASHDLQEPLRKIQAFSQRILEKDKSNLSATGTDYFGRIINAAFRMQNLIEALISYSKTNASETGKEFTDLNNLLRVVTEGLQDSIEEKNASIQYSHLPKLKIIPIQFQQLFINLISNAIKYSRTGVPPRINITAITIAGKDITDVDANGSINYWKISVEDNGIGFEQRYATKIFELFQRLHGASDYLGTGIGLAICNKIMRNHDGFISAVGNPGVGSVFNIYLPVKE